MCFLLVWQEITKQWKTLPYQPTLDGEFHKMEHPFTMLLIACNKILIIACKAQGGFPSILAFHFHIGNCSFIAYAIIL
jgi:hypothetical protein